MKQKLESSSRLEVTTVEEEGVLEAKTRVVLLGTVGKTSIRYRYNASVGIDLRRVEVTEEEDAVVFLLPPWEILNDGITPAERTPLLLSGGYYEDAPESGCWYPAKRVGDRVRRGEPLGKICGVFGDELFVYRAKEDGVLLYQTASLGIEKGTPMIAYGIFGNR